MSRRLLRSLFGKYLLLTNTVTSGLLDALGDVLEQRLERISPHDTPRTLRMGTVGFLLGPLDHFWYRFLDVCLPGRCASTVAKKVAVDTFIFGPISIILFYMSESLQLRRNISCVKFCRINKNDENVIYRYVQVGGQQLEREYGRD